MHRAALPYLLRRFALLGCLLGYLLAASSCQKAEIRDVEAQEKKWLGTWQVTEIKTVTTDTLGRVLTSATLTNQGSVDFRMAPGGSAGEVFKPALFEGPCVNSELVHYFSSKPSGDPTPTRGWTLYWDADPDGARVLLWAIGPLSSYHRTITLDSDDDHNRQLYYTFRSPSSGNNQLTFITWTLHK